MSKLERAGLGECDVATHVLEHWAEATDVPLQRSARAWSSAQADSPTDMGRTDMGRTLEQVELQVSQLSLCVGRLQEQQADR